MTFTLALAWMLSPSASATVTVDGVELEVVDAHLHVLESPGDFNLEGKASIIQQLPEFVVPYYSGISEYLTDPYAEKLGIAAQLDWAGVDRGVLLATYTQHTVAFTSNRFVESLLWDARNESTDGRPRFLGMASVNLDDFEDASIRQARLEALGTYLIDQRIIGIKLAHAHQSISFADPVLDDLYALAADAGVPVLLHTGVSPFPNTQSDSEYTNPAGLEDTIARFDGRGEEGRVEFVLAHIGTGDVRATAASLELAAAYDNVWLEVSALNQELVYDADGSESTVEGPQHPWVLRDIREMGLIDRTIFATDGPQQSGKIRSYLLDIVTSMQEAEYTTDEMARVFSGSFYECFSIAD